MTGPNKLATGFSGGLTSLTRVLTLIACVNLFVIMAISFVDVLGRYLFLAPVPAAYELISLLMPAVIFCALPNVVLNEGHVTVDLLDRYVSPVLARVQTIVVNIISALALMVLAWRLAVKGMDDFTYETTTNELWIAIWPFGIGMAALCGFAALVALLIAFRALFEAPVTGESQ